VRVKDGKAIPLQAWTGPECSSSDLLLIERAEKNHDTPDSPLPVNTAPRIMTFQTCPDQRIIPGALFVYYHSVLLVYHDVVHTTTVHYLCTRIVRYLCPMKLYY
jgi:hypothetical protein